MTHNKLHLYKPRNSKASLQQRLKYENKSSEKRGVVFVSPTKEDLSQGRGLVISSYETLEAKRNELTHWTPNIYTHGKYKDFKNRVIEGHTNDNLRQVNVIGFDIDTKEVDLYAIFMGCDKVELPRPNILLETPRGYQVFWVLETPFFANIHTNFKSIKIAEKISTNIRKAMASFVPVDVACTPFGFYRIPNDENILYFDDVPANTQGLISWSMAYQKEIDGRENKVIFSDAGKGSVIQTQTEWYAALLNAVSISGGHFGSGRNNSLFTLALANYSSEVSFEDAYNTLDQFNSALARPLGKNEFERTLKSAYTGRYNAPKKEYVESLLEMWTDGSVSYRTGNGVWYKFEKSREERSRSHYDEWQSDIFEYLEKNTTPENPFLQISLREMAKQIGMAYSSLKETLKRLKGQIIKQTVGRGAAAQSFFATNRMLFRHILYIRKKELQARQISFVELLPTRTLERSDIPTIEHLYYQYSSLIEPRPGASPPLIRTG